MKPGDICRTNLSKPGGLVKVLAIYPSTYVRANEYRLMAYIEHIEDHPYGYEKGVRGYYFVDELILVENGNETR